MECREEVAAYRAWFQSLLPADVQIDTEQPLNSGAALWELLAGV